MIFIENRKPPNLIFFRGTLKVFLTFQKPKIYHRQEGNLFLVDAAEETAARRSFEMQKDLGCQVQWWSPQTIKQHFPLYEPEKFVGGTFSPGDG